MDEIAEVKSEFSFHLNGCHISRAKLDRLWGLAREGFPPDAYVSIESIRKGKVESKVKSKSIDGLLAAVRMRTIAGNPNYINDLRLYIGEKTREVSININLAGGDILDQGVSVSVSGDEEWVRGRSSVLRELLEDTQSSLLTGRGHSRILLFFSGLLVALGISFSIASALSQRDSIGVDLLLMLSLSAVLAGGGFFAGSLCSIAGSRRNSFFFPRLSDQRLSP